VKGMTTIRCVSGNVSKEIETHRIYGIGGLYADLLIVDMDRRQVIATKDDWYDIFDERDTPEVNFLIELCRKSMH